MPDLVLDDVTLVYDDSGEPGLPPIVFLPGLSQARSTWARIVPAVAGRWRVLALDHRGHGESSHAGSYVLTRYGGDTAAFLERVVGEPAVLVGHSSRCSPRPATPSTTSSPTASSPNSSGSSTQRADRVESNGSAFRDPTDADGQTSAVSHRTKEGANLIVEAVRSFEVDDVTDPGDHDELR